MARDDVIRLAHEAGLPLAWASSPGAIKWVNLERFARLIAEHEREECALECDALAELNRESETDSMWQWGECAAAIRARVT